jgi:hypothetical protein
MRRGLAWAAGLAGILTAFLLRRRREAVPAADPAEELRLRLAASRVAEDATAPSAPVREPESADPDARRQDVHAEARAAIDEMRGDSTE